MFGFSRYLTFTFVTCALGVSALAADATNNTTSFSKEQSAFAPKTKPGAAKPVSNFDREHRKKPVAATPVATTQPTSTTSPVVKAPPAKVESSDR